ncbi:hypothetical protein FMLHJGGC_00158 [Staphylococcus phage BSwM-KMM1]|nr:hypothetical protein FMLHJGGC_00158 [Pseudomonas phage BSwM KMM1]
MDEEGKNEETPGDKQPIEQPDDKADDNNIGNEDKTEEE